MHFILIVKINPTIGPNHKPGHRTTNSFRAKIHFNGGICIILHPATLEASEKIPKCEVQAIDTDCHKLLEKDQIIHISFATSWNPVQGRTRGYLKKKSPLCSISEQMP